MAEGEAVPGADRGVEEANVTDTTNYYACLALDLAKSLGWALSDKHGNVVESGTEILKGDAPERFGRLLGWLCLHLPAVAIVIEKPLPTKAASSGDLIGYAAIAAAVAHRAGLEFHEYHNATVKKAVTGDGHATKETVRKMVERITGREVGSDDESDACAVLLTHLNRAKRKVAR